MATSTRSKVKNRSNDQGEEDFIEKSKATPESVPSSQLTENDDTPAELPKKSTHSSHESPDENPDDDKTETTPAPVDIKGTFSGVPGSPAGELKSDKDESETNNGEPKVAVKKNLNEFSAIWYYVVTFLVVAIAIIGFSVVNSEQPQCPGCDSNYDFVKIFENGLQELQTNFTSQTERFWKILKSRGLAHLRTKSPRQPLVLLFMAPPSAHNVADCFTKNLAAKLDPKHSKELTTIDGKDYQTSPGHEAKEKLDKVLSGALQSGHRATLVNHLELLPPPSPLLFYSYCDNDNAPFKHVAILFTVHLPNEPDPSLSAVETEGLVEKFLSSEVWSNAYNKDAVAALLSRITDTVVILSGEDEAALSSVCDSP